MYLKPNIAKLKQRKRELGWTNQRLAKESGVPVGTLNKIFNGSTRYPRDETVDALARAMGLDYYELQASEADSAVIRETGIYKTVKKEGRATLDTYYSLPDELRAELIDGKLYYVSAPSLRHQSIVVALSAELYNYFALKKKKYRVFASFCDVRLDGDEYTMVEPDIFVVQGKEQFANGAYCMGAPEFVVEIVSLSSSKHDYELKRYKYQNAGVKEYWIVDPIKMRVVVYAFAKDTVPAVYTFEDRVKPYLYPDLEIDFERIGKEMV